MNYLVFYVFVERFDVYWQWFKDKGVWVGLVFNYDDSEMQVFVVVYFGVYVCLFYFQDFDGIILEFVCWIKEFIMSDVQIVLKMVVDW